MKNTLEYALQKDEQDELRSFRERFYFPQHNGRDQHYFCGNSLGLQPKSVKDYIDVELKDWRELGVEGHFEGKNAWFYYHHHFSEKLANLVGAKPNEVVVMNTLTTNLHLMMISFYQPKGKRYKIMLEGGAFPSDYYAVESQLKLHGHDWKDGMIELTPREGEYTLRTEDILAKIEENEDELALIMLGGVNYYTGQLFDMKAITDAGHRIGAKVGFDLAHAAGNIDLKLNEWGPDFAVWCSYKYFNAGPGGPGSAFVHERHANNAQLLRLAGWWGYDEEKRFEMKKGFIPMEGAASWQLSNAQVMAMAPYLASIEIFAEAGMERLCAKRDELTAYLECLIDQSSNNYKIITPRSQAERGAQLSILVNKDAKKLNQLLAAEGVRADYREPDVIRLAPVPLYNSFEDVFRFVEILNKSYNRYFKSCMERMDGLVKYRF
ncbi:MAG TPA: kynureninase [Bacteroidetes bacterium]|nr:kynureninase [Bacteroidota bacterium]